MNRDKIVKILSYSLLLFFITTSGYAYVSPGKPVGYVNDFASILTQEQISTLEQKIITFNASTSNEIAVVIVKDLQGDYIDNYAVKLFEEWKIGQNKKDNGILLLIALHERNVRIEVGYGLESVLTDALSSQIITKDIIPSFKQNNFYEGVSLAVDHIILSTEGEYFVDAKSTQNHSVSFEAVSILFVFGAQLLSFIVSLFARSKSFYAGGVFGGIISFLIVFFVFSHLAMIVKVAWVFFATILGALFDYFVSTRYQYAIHTGSSIPWYIGGRGFGSRTSGGGIRFGGFSGGRSGGGGASGGW